jgi:hypothetical protein
MKETFIREDENIFSINTGLFIKRNRHSVDNY